MVSSYSFSKTLRIEQIEYFMCYYVLVLLQYNCSLIFILLATKAKVMTLALTCLVDDQVHNYAAKAFIW